MSPPLQGPCVLQPPDGAEQNPLLALLPLPPRGLPPLLATDESLNLSHQRGLSHSRSHQLTLGTKLLLFQVHQPNFKWLWSSSGSKHCWNKQEGGKRPAATLRAWNPSHLPGTSAGLGEQGTGWKPTGFSFIPRAGTGSSRQAHLRAHFKHLPSGLDYCCLCLEQIQLCSQLAPSPENLTLLCSCRPGHQAWRTALQPAGCAGAQGPLAIPLPPHPATRWRDGEKALTI